MQIRESTSSKNAQLNTEGETSCRFRSPIQMANGQGHGQVLHHPAVSLSLSSSTEDQQRPETRVYTLQTCLVKPGFFVVCREEREATLADATVVTFPPCCCGNAKPSGLAMLSMRKKPECQVPSPVVVAATTLTQPCQVVCDLKYGPLSST